MELVRTFVISDWELKTIFNEPDKATVPFKLDEPLAAPGSGRYQINSLQLAADKFSPGDALNLSIQISGENIAYLSTEIYYKDNAFDYFYGPVMQDYVSSAAEKNVNGVIHPTWDAEITLSLEIKLLFRLLTDGINAAFAFMHQVGYGHKEYQLEGLFSKKNSGNASRARLKFDDLGEMTDKRIIQEKRGRLLTHDLIIKSGDIFIPVVNVLTDLNLSNPKMRPLQGISNTLTKLEEPFHWVDEAALPGDYLLGLVIEDFNGDQFHHFLPFTVVGE